MTVDKTKARVKLKKKLKYFHLASVVEAAMHKGRVVRIEPVSILCSINPRKRLLNLKSGALTVIFLLRILNKFCFFLSKNLSQKALIRDKSAYLEQI